MVLLWIMILVDALSNIQPRENDIDREEIKFPAHNSISHYASLVALVVLQAPSVV